MSSNSPCLPDHYQPYTAPLDWPVREAREWSDWGIDPGSGAVIRRFTASPFQHNLIYTEQPYTSPDGRRFAICRHGDTFNPAANLIVGDVMSGQMWMVEPSVRFRTVTTAAYGEWLYYPTHDGGVRCVSMMTLEKQQIVPAGGMPPDCEIVSISPDQRTALIYDRREADAPALSVMPFATGEHTVIYRDPDNKNPHAQFDWLDGTRVLFQKCDWTA